MEVLLIDGPDAKYSVHLVTSWGTGVKDGAHRVIYLPK